MFLTIKVGFGDGSRCIECIQRKEWIRDMITVQHHFEQYVQVLVRMNVFETQTVPFQIFFVSTMFRCGGMNVSVQSSTTLQKTFQMIDYKRGKVFGMEDSFVGGCG